MANNTVPRLSRRHAEVMEIVWQQGEVTVNDVWGILLRRRRVARNTVQTMMMRLEQTRWLRHRSAGKAFLYSAAQPRETVGRRALRALRETLFDGSADRLMAALLKDQGLSDDEAEQIRAMIRSARERTQKGGA